MLSLWVQADVVVPFFGDLFPDEPLPQDGFIDLPDRYIYSYTLSMGLA